MLLFRGAIAAAEDRNHDERVNLSPMEVEYLKYVVFAGEGQPPETYHAAAGRLPTAVHPTVTVTPLVNTGRWVVPCPWCYSASVASRTDHRFFCVECRNVGAQGKWVKVAWPESHEEIEALLVMRPSPRSRHWLAHETVEDLLTQNETLGVM